MSLQEEIEQRHCVWSQIPSPGPRPNIHEYAKGNKGDMGKYGLHSPAPVSHDVVDKMQSKPQELGEEKKKDSTKNKQIKVVYTSDSDNSRSEPESRGNSPNTSQPHNESLNNTSNSSFNRQDSTGSEETDQQREDEKSYGWWGIIMCILFALIAVIYYNAIQINIPQEQISSKRSSKILHKSGVLSQELREIGKEYDIDDDSILKIRTGISTIFNKQDTGSFLFVYRSKSTIEQEKIDEFINEVADVTSKYFRDDTAKYLVLEGSKLEVQSHSELINKYKENITKNGVMVVKDIDEVPSRLAMAFHYYCDDQNPVAKRSAVLFTLDVRKCSFTDEQVTNSFIEKCLIKKWSGVPQDNILPLLNRVMSYIVDITGKQF